MKNLVELIEIKLMPLAGRIAQQRHLGAIRDGYISFMPFIIVGSILLVISSFPSESYKAFMASIFGQQWGTIIEIPFNAIFSTMALFIAYLVAYRLAERNDIDRSSAGILSLSCFLILTPFAQNAQGAAVIPMEWIGSRGLFVGMLGAIVWTEMFTFLLRKNLVIKMPEGVPPAVEKSFAALIPALIILSIALAIRIIFASTSYHTIHEFIYTVIAMPVRHFGTSYFGSLLTVLSITVLWSVGINSGSMINGILRPFWLDNQAENLAATHAGLVPPHVVTEQFYDMIWMGGSGATLSLVIAMLIFARSQHIKKITKLAVGSSIFNINEPILFGLPVIMNPIMLIPFNLVPVVLVSIQYAAMASGLVSTTTGVYIPWTLPPVFSGLIVTGHVSGALIQFFNLIVGAALYLPFFKVLDRQYKSTEHPTETNN